MGDGGSFLNAIHTYLLVRGELIVPIVVILFQSPLEAEGQPA